jgi:hypothetical protein
LQDGHGRSNCETLFGISAIPSDNYIRLMLGVSPAAFDRLFVQALEAAGPLSAFQRLGGRVLIALDGTEHFCLRKIHCQNCCTRRRSNGGTECFLCTGRRSKIVSATLRSVGLSNTDQTSLISKPASHQTISKNLEGAELSEHRQTVSKRGKCTATIYR